MARSFDLNPKIGVRDDVRFLMGKFVGEGNSSPRYGL
jgi:hypothetical protein